MSPSEPRRYRVTFTFDVAGSYQPRGVEPADDALLVAMGALTAGYITDPEDDIRALSSGLAPGPDFAEMNSGSLIQRTLGLLARLRECYGPCKISGHELGAGFGIEVE